MNDNNFKVSSAVLSELSSLLCSGSGRAAFCTAADQKQTTELLPLVTEVIKNSLRIILCNYFLQSERLGTKTNL